MSARIIVEVRCDGGLIRVERDAPSGWRGRYQGLAEDVTEAAQVLEDIAGELRLAHPIGAES